MKQVSTESAATTTYDFTYVGVTNALSKEALSGATNSTKRYAYDAFGNRATIAETVGATTSRYSYLYDPHTSVSLLIDQANVVKESYGYVGYGAANAALSKTAAGFSNKTNPYRYTGKRLDTGSGTLDMGARRYSAGTGRFLQHDSYSGALANFRLAIDPLTNNRYLFAAGNPINFIEVDGHVAASVAGGGGDSIPVTFTTTRADGVAVSVTIQVYDNRNGGTVTSVRTTYTWTNGSGQHQATKLETSNYSPPKYVDLRPGLGWLKDHTLEIAQLGASIACKALKNPSAVVACAVIAAGANILVDAVRCVDNPTKRGCGKILKDVAEFVCGSVTGGHLSKSVGVKNPFVKACERLTRGIFK